jgi:hypothetical protein
VFVGIGAMPFRGDNHCSKCGWGGVPGWYGVGSRGRKGLALLLAEAYGGGRGWNLMDKTKAESQEGNQLEWLGVEER